MNLRMCYYRTAGVTIEVTADLPITDQTFHPRLSPFQVDDPGEDVISIHHYFSLPHALEVRPGNEIYHKAPWAIYRHGEAWVYRSIGPHEHHQEPHVLAVFSRDYRRGHIYSPDDTVFRKGGIHSLTMMPSDQILLAQVLADRQGCLLHSSAVILNNQGLLFVGHSGSGKSTIATILMEHGQILCDDRNVVRRWPEGFVVHGTWSHGDVPLVSAADAPLRAILFLEKATANCVVPLADRREVLHRILCCLIKPLVTASWWEKVLDVTGRLAAEVPAYELQFDRSGRVVELLKALVS